MYSSLQFPLYLLSVLVHGMKIALSYEWHCVIRCSHRALCTFVKLEIVSDMSLSISRQCRLVASAIIMFVIYTVEVRETYAQTPPPTATLKRTVSVSTQVASGNPATSGVTKNQWEYLVVSFGKTLFANPDRDPEAKQIGLSKLLTYSQAGVLSASEAMLTQKQMDSLGHYGWELVSVVGAIGGDQQMVFKRAFDPTQSQREAVMIREEGVRLLAAQKAAAERLARAVKEPSEELVDLDAVERATATEVNRQTEERRLTDAIASIKQYNTSDVKIVSTANGPKASSVTANVSIDGTETLLQDSNKYRSSEAKKLASNAALAYYGAAGLRQEYDFDSPKEGFYLAEVKISVTVTVTYQGKPKIVAVENVGGKWPERKK